MDLWDGWDREPILEEGQDLYLTGREDLTEQREGPVLQILAWNKFGAKGGTVMLGSRP